MKQLSNRAAWTLIRLTYLLPLISGGILLIWACVPHLFFFYRGEVYETQSLFGLIGNTWKECAALSEGSAGAVWFSFVMRTFVILSYLAILGYTLTAIPAAICSCVAFSKSPTDPNANRAKRWMRFFCPNRVTYVISNLLLLLPAFFPQILCSNYRSQLGYAMEVCYIPSWMPGWLITALLVTVNVVSFLCLLSAQSREHMDMFRLYKAKPQNQTSK